MLSALQDRLRTFQPVEFSPSSFPHNGFRKARTAGRSSECADCLCAAADDAVAATIVAGPHKKRWCLGCALHTVPRRVHADIRFWAMWTWTAWQARKMQTRCWGAAKGWVVAAPQARNFKAALEMFGRIGEVAEAEGHHPDLHLEGYQNVRVELSTHSSGATPCPRHTDTCVHPILWFSPAAPLMSTV